MQDIGRGGYGQENRIYKRKYEIDVEPSYGFEHRTAATTTHYDLVNRQQMTQARNSHTGWAADSRPYQASERQSYGHPVSQPPQVSNFKGNREDDLLKKLEMYEQKYNLGTNLAKQPNRASYNLDRQYEARQIGHRQSLPIPVPRQPMQRDIPRQSYGRDIAQREPQPYYSTNSSPKNDFGRHRQAWPEQYVRPEAAGRYNERRVSEIDVQKRRDTKYGCETEPHYQYNRQTKDFRQQREFKDQREIRQPRQPREPREIRQPREVRQPRQAREPRQPRQFREPRYSTNEQNLPERPPAGREYNEQRPMQKAYESKPYERPSTSNAYKPAERTRSVTHSIKQPIQPCRTSNQYRPSLRAAPEYRQTGKLSGGETRNNAYRQRRQREDTQTQQQPIYITQNTEQSQTVPRRAALQERDVNITEKSYWEDEEPKRNLPKQREVDNEREDRLRNIRSKVNKGEDQENFNLQRSEKKQSLRERSQQLRQKMNEPSPLKTKLSSNLEKTDRENKENIQIVEKAKKEQPQQRRKYDVEPPKELTPPKSRNNSKEKRLDFQQDTYRKIETINDLNNKINERIKHILSSFNQEAC